MPKSDASAIILTYFALYIFVGFLPNAHAPSQLNIQCIRPCKRIYRCVIPAERRLVSFNQVSFHLSHVIKTYDICGVFVRKIIFLLTLETIDALSSVYLNFPRK